MCLQLQAQPQGAVGSDGIHSQFYLFQRIIQSADRPGMEFKPAGSKCFHHGFFSLNVPADIDSCISARILESIGVLSFSYSLAFQLPTS